MRFDDREHAGRLLAARLEDLRRARPVVLALSRGGLPVAYPVARSLRAPLDLIVVRKLRAAAAPELSVGAIAEGGVTYLNPTHLRDARMRQEDALALAEEAHVELASRVRLYRGGVPAPRLHGRTVLVVDDFVATGTTARAAALAARKRGATRIVLAVPVVSAAIVEELRRDYDEVVALEAHTGPGALGEAYERLEEITDEAVLAWLERARLEIFEDVEPATT